MSRNGGQASSAVLRADCNIIWLPGTARQSAAAPLEPPEADIASTSQRPRGLAGRSLKALALTAAVTAQAVALCMVLAAGGTGEPWASGAAFGIAAAIASWAGVQMAGRVARGQSSSPCPTSGDLALHDAFTLSLVIAASAVLGAIGAALLLPAGAALSLTIRRIVRRSAAKEQDAVLLLIVSIAMAGLCGPWGYRAWAVAAIVLAAAVMVRAGHSWLHPRLQLRIWHIWGTSALMCSAIALAGHTGTGLPAAVGLTGFMPLLAGALYGAGAGTASRILRRHSQTLSATVPFLTVVLEAGLWDPGHLRQAAAAVLLAAALAVSHYYPKARRKPAVAAANAWPSGWPQ